MQTKLGSLFSSIPSLTSILSNKDSFPASFNASIKHTLTHLGWSGAFVQYEFKHNPQSYWITSSKTRRVAVQRQISKLAKLEAGRELFNMDNWPGSSASLLGEPAPSQAYRLFFKTKFRASIQIFFFGEDLGDENLQENVQSFLELIFKLVNRNDFENRLMKVKNKLYMLLQRDHLKLRPAELIALTCPIISSFFNAERTTFFVYNDKNSKLQSIHAEGPTPLKIELNVGEGLVGSCFQTLKSSYTNMPYSRREFQKRYDRASGFITQSSLVTPLYKGSTPFGVLQILNRKTGFAPENVEEIEIIAKTLTGHLNFYEFTRGEDSARSELEALLQTIPEVLYRLDLEGNFGFISQEVLKWGYFREDLIGKHFSDIIHPEDVDRVSRDKVLPIYAGKVTGQKGAPGLFDERRGGKRGTKRKIGRAHV